MQWRVILGTISLVITMIALGFVAVTEQDRMESFTRAYDARQVEAGAALFDSNCQSCHGNRGQGIEGFAPALNAADLFDGTRLAEIGWAGTVEDYVQSAIAGGRPRASASFSTYPQRMPTWGEDFGGPLRNDQVKSLVTFVMNWGKAYEGQAVAAPAIIGVGVDITAALPAGDAAKGEALATAKGCVACHVLGPAGPPWLALADANGEGVATRAEKRVAEAYGGAATTPEQYLFESIVQPNIYQVPGASYVVNGNSIMPANYGSTLTAQEAADLIAYLLTLK